MEANHLKKFLDAQNQVYLKALEEIKNGKKETHWMWFIFPQLKGLGQSETAQFYALTDLQEATDYLAHPVLGRHLIEITEELLNIKNKSAQAVFGYPDDIKLCSCMTLFANIKNSDTVFTKVLSAFFDGIQDEHTLKLLVRNKFSHDVI